MTTLNLSLPSALAEYVREQAARYGFDDSGKYIEALIREDQKRCAKAELEEKLLEGLNSERVEMTEDKWKELRQQFEQRRRKATGT